jgi:hypothetical protein
VWCAPRLPVRQWVLAVPKRLRYFVQRDAVVQGAALGLFLRVVEQRLRASGCPSILARAECLIGSRYQRAVTSDENYRR